MAVFTNVMGGGVPSDELTALLSDVLKGKTAVTSDSDDEAAEGTLELTGDAADSHVLSGKTYYNTDAKGKRTGEMPNRGAVSIELEAGGTYDIPVGYHNGSGKVEAKSLAAQTDANAAAEQILNGYSAWVKGKKIPGTMPNRGALNWSASNTTHAVQPGYYTGGTLDSRPAYNNGYNAGKSAGLAISGTSVGCTVSSSKLPFISNGASDNRYYIEATYNIPGTIHSVCAATSKGVVVWCRSWGTVFNAGSAAGWHPFTITGNAYITNTALRLPQYARDTSMTSIAIYYTP